MDITLIIKIAGIGILISVINTVMDGVGKNNWTMFTTLAGVIIVLSMVLTEIGELFNTVKTMFQLY